MMPVPETSRNSAPEPARARIEMLDAIRGFALFGILLMNLEAFNGPILGAVSGIDAGLHGIDRWADALVYVFVQGKFWTLFALLFGIGFATMHERAGASAGFEAMYRRRLFFLMLIGLAHLWLVWEGDILFSYALAGFVLLAWQRAGGEFRIWSIALWFSVPLLLLALIAALASPTDAGDGGFREKLAEQAGLLATGSYADVVRWRIGKFGQDLASTLFLLPMTVAVFALGVRLQRAGLASALPQAARRDWLSAAVPWLAGLGLMCASLAIAPEIDPTRTDAVFAMVNGLNLLAGVLMSAGMYLGLRCMWANAAGRRALQVLAPAGRMALSNYLAQSLLCTLLFNGYGLGHYGQLPRAWHIPFAMLLMAMQVTASTWWLRHFRIGPLEYLWRWATYRERPKFVS